jgi:hypothetical protein
MGASEVGSREFCDFSRDRLGLVFADRLSFDLANGRVCLFWCYLPEPARGFGEVP